MIVYGVYQSDKSKQNSTHTRVQLKNEIEKHFAQELPIIIAEEESRNRQLIRYFIEHPIKVPLWKRQRSNMVIQKAQALDQYNQIEGNKDNDQAVLLEGYLRNCGMHIDNSITIPGFSDFKLNRIDVMSHKSPQDTVIRTLYPSSEQQNVQRINNDQAMQDEDGSNTLQNGKSSKSYHKLFQKVPKGTSEYQASWFMEDKKLEDQPSDEMQSEDDMSDLGSSQSEQELIQLDQKGKPIVNNDQIQGNDIPELQAMDTQEDIGSIITKDDEELEVQDMNVEDYIKDLEMKRREERAKREAKMSVQDELERPDEVEVPLDIPARIRFSKYRGIKSLKKSQWDADDNLPLEFQKIFAFENFKSAKKRALKSAQDISEQESDKSVLPGNYVKLYVSGMDKSQANQLLHQVNSSEPILENGATHQDNTKHIFSKTHNGVQPPLMAFGLMRYEGNLSVLNFGFIQNRHNASLQSSEALTTKNKDELLFITGIRNFYTRPIFSEDSINSDKFKMERLLREGQNYQASIYAPIMYPPMPLIAMKQIQDHSQQQQQQQQLQQDESVQNQFEFIASGTLKSCDPNKIILKRIVLSGYPFRTHKRRATVRYMFHNPEDVRWFRPIDLWTKNGRRGRIIEPLGTHGYMKCEFDGHVSSGDTIFLTLYKRVFPKWPQDMKFS